MNHWIWAIAPLYVNGTIYEVEIGFYLYSKKTIQQLCATVGSDGHQGYGCIKPATGNPQWI